MEPFLLLLTNVLVCTPFAVKEQVIRKFNYEADVSAINEASFTTAGDAAIVWMGGRELLTAGDETQLEAPMVSEHVKFPGKSYAFNYLADQQKFSLQARLKSFGWYVTPPAPPHLPNSRLRVCGWTGDSAANEILGRRLSWTSSAGCCPGRTPS